VTVRAACGIPVRVDSMSVYGGWLGAGSQVRIRPFSSWVTFSLRKVLEGWGWVCLGKCWSVRVSLLIR